MTLENVGQRFAGRVGRHDPAAGFAQRLLYLPHPSPRRKDGDAMNRLKSLLAFLVLLMLGPDVWAQPLLYSNGPLVNVPHGGFGGADASRLQSSLGMNTLGFADQLARGNRLSDNFKVPTPGWTIERVTVFVYQTGSTTASTINDIRLRVWNGPPDDPGSGIVWGNLNTNVLASSSFSGAYRDSTNIPGDGQRPIMAATVAPNVFLAPGTYWLEWQAGGVLASGPFAPPITVNGLTTTGNALEFLASRGTWQSALDDGTGTPQGFPFTIEGQGPPVSVSFFDVPLEYWAWENIEALVAAGVTAGCSVSPPLYCPESPVTREQMAAFILRSLGEFSPPPPPTQRFADVPPTSPFYAYIDRMAVLGITGGCSPTDYCPTAPVTREQMAAFIIRALGEPNPPPPPTQRFADVPPTNPFYAFIDRMAVRGITGGCSPTDYCPQASVTRAQMAVFLVTAFSL